MVLGLALLVILVAVPGESGSEAGGGVNVRPSDMLAVLMSVVILIGASRQSTTLARMKAWVTIPLAMIFVAGAAATLASTDPSLSLVGFARTAELFVVLPLVTYLALQSRGDIRIILGAILLLGVAEGSIGIHQSLTETGAGYGASQTRAIGTFGAYEIQALAAVVSYSLVTAIAVAAVARGLTRFAAVLAAVCLSTSLALTLSRGSWIATTVAVMGVLVVQNWRAAVTLVTAIALVGGAYLLLGNYDRQNSVVARAYSTFRVGSAPDQSVKDRYALWSAAKKIFVSDPLTGTGPKTFPRIRDKYVPLTFSGGSDIYDVDAGYRRVALLSPHNQYLLLASEQGIFALASYVALLLSLLVAVGLRLRQRMDDKEERVLALATFGFLILHGVLGLYSDFGGSTAVLTGVLLGCGAWVAAGCRTTEVTDPATRLGRDRRRPATGLWTPARHITDDARH